MRKAIIITALVSAAGIVLGAGLEEALETAAEERKFLCFVEMTAEGEFKAADKEIRLDQESTLIIVARGYYAKYLVKDPDGTVKKEKVLWEEKEKPTARIAAVPAFSREQPTVRIAAVPTFSWDDFISKWKKLYPALVDVKLSEAHFRTIILKDVAPEGETIDVRYWLIEGAEMTKEFEVSRPLLIKFVSGKTDGPFEDVGKKRWLELDKTLFLALRGYNIQTQIIKKDGVVSELKTYTWAKTRTTPKPYVNEKFLGFCETTFHEKLKGYEYLALDFSKDARDGDTLIVTWENATNPADTESSAFKLLKSVWEHLPGGWSDISVNTVLNITLGGGGKQQDDELSYGAGGQVPILFKRFPDSDAVEKGGVGFSINVAQREVINEETQHRENLTAVAVGGVLAVKFRPTPFFILVGLNTTTNLDEDFIQLTIGIGAPMAQ